MSCVRGLGLDGRARVVAADTTAAVVELSRIHRPSRVVATAMGRLATGAVLLAASLEKLSRREPVLTLEMDGGGPAGRMFATASPSGWVRAFVANPQARVPPTEAGRVDVGAVIGRDGHLVVTRDAGAGTPYRGIVPLYTGEVAKDLAWYLTESEQSPAAVVLGVSLTDSGEVHTARGLLVQLLPGVSDLEAAELTARVEALGPMADSDELADDPTAWCRQLFPGGFEAADEVEVRFDCGCSRERVLAALALLSPDDLREVAAEGAPGTTLTCEFCRTDYRVSATELEQVLAARRRMASS